MSEVPIWLDPVVQKTMYQHAEVLDRLSPTPWRSHPTYSDLDASDCLWRMSSRAKERRERFGFLKADGAFENEARLARSGSAIGA